MNRLSFFKLPLIFVTLYFVCDCSLSIGGIAIQMMPRVDGYGDLWQYVLVFLPEQLYQLIPDCLLLFGVSSISLYRVNVHIITLKNIILLVINVLVLLIVTYVAKMGMYELFHPDLIQTMYKQPRLMIFLFIIITAATFYLLNGLLTYIFIKALSNQLDKDQRPFVLNNTNSTEIHFILFLTFFFFISIGFYFFIMNTFFPQYDYATFVKSDLFSRLTIVFFDVLIIILVTKNMFTQVFVVLQTDRIIKSALASSLFIFILNLVMGSVLFLLFQMSVIDTLDPTIITVLFWILFIVQLIIACVIVRKVTKKYFSRMIGRAVLL